MLAPRANTGRITGEPETLSVNNDANTRVASWSQWVPTAFPGMRVAREQPSPGEARGMRLGGGSLYEITSHTDLVVEQPAVPPGNGKFGVIVPLEGSSTVRQGAHTCSISPGQLNIGGGYGHFSIEQSGAVKQAILSLPLAAILSRQPSLSFVPLRTLEPDAPGVPLVRSLMLETLSQGARLDGVQRWAAYNALIQLVGALLSGTEGNGVAWRVQRALTVIDANLHSPEFRAQDVAAEQRAVSMAISGPAHALINQPSR